MLGLGASPRDKNPTQSHKKIVLDEDRPGVQDKDYYRLKKKEEKKNKKKQLDPRYLGAEKPVKKKGGLFGFGKKSRGASVKRNLDEPMEETTFINTKEVSEKIEKSPRKDSEQSVKKRSRKDRYSKKKNRRKSAESNSVEENNIEKDLAKDTESNEVESADKLVDEMKEKLKEEKAGIIAKRKLVVDTIDCELNVASIEEEPDFVLPMLLNIAQTEKVIPLIDLDSSKEAKYIDDLESFIATMTSNQANSLEDDLEGIEGLIVGLEEPNEYYKQPVKDVKASVIAPSIETNITLNREEVKSKIKESRDRAIEERNLARESEVRKPRSRRRSLTPEDMLL